MIPDERIPELIHQQLPAFTAARGNSVSKVIHAFMEYTSTLVQKGQLQEAGRCFRIAGVLYRNGSNLLKNAIENVYIYGLSPLVDTHQQKLNELLPLPLQQVRIQHHQI
ncbi:hypothetical protein MKQ68_21640 [Chitinophaga horti]|uniref:DUF7674 domain-containing protein n=1 Tax=Chitinophaga horti TaxID=2920382 RepID=A0ABY6IZ85_9BACT|nr:hypothetical protein [Chitinophaga horti]UYQ92685.1 hypothetical protein MKQ68_21640 [Chitinophaga horti]